MRLSPWSTAAAVVAVGALGVGILSTGTSAAQGAPVPSRPYVTGWLPYWMPDSATDSVVNNAGVFDDASPFVFAVQSATEIDLQITGTQWQTMRNRLQNAGVDVIPTMSTDLSADQFASLLSSPTRRQAHVDALVRLAVRNNVDGIDLDYESINFGSSSAKQTVRTLYPVFVTELQRRLALKGKLLSVTVASRTSVADPNWWVYDYAALGAAADRIRIMTYDYHWSGGTPGPIAPKWWVDKVLTFATGQIEPNKISFGLPAYGRDWFAGKISGNCPAAARTTISRTSSQMRVFASQLGIAPRWSELGTSRTFTYVQRYSSGGMTCRAKREVWFDDARSVAEKVQLVGEHQVRGVAVWALGYETDLMWDKLREYGRTIALRQPTLTVAAPKVVAYGDSTVVRAAVRNAGAPVASKRVVLERLVDGGSAWVQVDTRRTNAQGIVQFDVSPKSDVRWRVRTYRDWLFTPGTSGTAGTNVAYNVKLNRARRETPRGSQWSLAGSVSPATNRTTVVRQKRVDGHWVDKAQSRVNVNGAFSFEMRARVAGDKQFRVIALPGPWARGVSRTIDISVA